MTVWHLSLVGGLDLRTCLVGRPIRSMSRLRAQPVNVMLYYSNLTSNFVIVVAMIKLINLCAFSLAQSSWPADCRFIRMRLDGARAINAVIASDVRFGVRKGCPVLVEHIYELRLLLLSELIADVPPVLLYHALHGRYIS